MFTGPIFEEDDPVYEHFPKIQYPVRCWKVVVAPVKGGKLSATDYVLDKSDVIARYGTETTALFGDYREFQVPLREIEELTQLQFRFATQQGKQRSLREFDPFDTPLPRRRSTGFPESKGSTSAVHGRRANFPE